MDKVSKRKAGRPRGPVLDKTRIVEAALVLVDADGDFTLQDLARALGVHVTSIYHHAEGRSGVLDLLREHVLSKIDVACLDDPAWDVALTSFFRSYRNAFAHHPRLVGLLMSTPASEPTTILALERVVSILINSAGLDATHSLEILLALEVFAQGSALDTAVAGDIWNVPDDIDAPSLRKALAAQRSSQALRQSAFDRGLTALLASICPATYCGRPARHTVGMTVHEVAPADIASPGATHPGLSD